MPLFFFIPLINVLVLPSSFGQSTSDPTDASTTKAYLTCPNYLDCAQKLADDENARIRREVDQLQHRSEGFLPCDEDRLAFEQDYVNWFLTNKNEIKKVYDALNTAIDLQNQKLTTINQQTVEVNPLPNQTVQTTVTVSLKMIKDYLTQLNGRLKTCPDDQVDALMAGVENPKWNYPAIAHSQVQAAIDQINKIVSASLQQKDVVSKIVFTQNIDNRASGNAMTLILETDYKDKTLLKQDLFKNEVPTFSESEKWALITASTIEINGNPIDGGQRYSNMQSLRTSGCGQKDNGVMTFDTNSGVPFVTYGSQKQ